MRLEYGHGNSIHESLTLREEQIQRPCRWRGEIAELRKCAGWPFNRWAVHKNYEGADSVGRAGRKPDAGSPTHCTDAVFGIGREVMRCVWFIRTQAPCSALDLFGQTVKVFSIPGRVSIAEAATGQRRNRLDYECHGKQHGGTRLASHSAALRIGCHSVSSRACSRPNKA